MAVWVSVINKGILTMQAIVKKRHAGGMLLGNVKIAILNMASVYCYFTSLFSVINGFKSTWDNGIA